MTLVSLTLVSLTYIVSSGNVTAFSSSPSTTLTNNASWAIGQTTYTQFSEVHLIDLADKRNILGSNVINVNEHGKHNLQPSFNDGERFSCMSDRAIAHLILSGETTEFVSISPVDELLLAVHIIVCEVCSWPYFYENFIISYLHIEISI